MNARTPPVAVVLGLILALCASAAQLSLSTSAQSQVALDLPLRTWVPRPLPTIGAGVPAGRASVVKGASARDKVVRLEGVGAVAVGERLP